MQMRTSPPTTKVSQTPCPLLLSTRKLRLEVMLRDDTLRRMTLQIEHSRFLEDRFVGCTVEIKKRLLSFLKAESYSLMITVPLTAGKCILITPRLSLVMTSL